MTIQASVMVTRINRFGERLINEVREGVLTPELAIKQFCDYYMITTKDMGDLLKLFVLKRASEREELTTNATVETEVLVEGVAI